MLTPPSNAHTISASAPRHLKFELELLAIEPRIVLVDNTMVVRADDNDVRGVVVLRTSDTGNRRTCRYRNGHSVVQQRPVHCLLRNKSAFVVHFLIYYRFTF